MPSKGQRVRYVAIAGDVYPAVITTVHPDGRVDLDVQTSLRNVVVPLTRVEAQKVPFQRGAWMP